MKAKLKEYPTLVKNYRVPSKSEPGVVHLVQRYSDGKLFCDCMAGSMGRECWHKTVVRKKLDADVVA